MSTTVFMTTMNTAASSTTAATTGRSPLKIAFSDSCPRPVSQKTLSVTIAPASRARCRSRAGSSTGVSAARRPCL